MCVCVTLMFPEIIQKWRKLQQRCLSCLCAAYNGQCDCSLLFCDCKTTKSKNISRFKGSKKQTKFYLWNIEVKKTKKNLRAKRQNHCVTHTDTQPSHAVIQGSVLGENVALDRRSELLGVRCLAQGHFSNALKVSPFQVFQSATGTRTRAPLTTGSFSNTRSTNLCIKENMAAFYIWKEPDKGILLLFKMIE